MGKDFAKIPAKRRLSKGVTEEMFHVEHFQRSWRSRFPAGYKVHASAGSSSPGRGRSPDRSAAGPAKDELQPMIVPVSQQNCSTWNIYVPCLATNSSPTPTQRPCRRRLDDCEIGPQGAPKFLTYLMPTLRTRNGFDLTHGWRDCVAALCHRSLDPVSFHPEPAHEAVTIPRTAALPLHQAQMRRVMRILRRCG